MYDTKCYQLAKDFLSDHPAIDREQNRQFLAQAIQDAIEDWIEVANLYWAARASNILITPAAR